MSAVADVTHEEEEEEGRTVGVLNWRANAG